MQFNTNFEFDIEEILNVSLYFQQEQQEFMRKPSLNLGEVEIRNISKPIKLETNQSGDTGASSNESMISSPSGTCSFFEEPVASQEVSEEKSTPNNEVDYNQVVDEILCPSNEDSCSKVRDLNVIHSRNRKSST